MDLEDLNLVKASKRAKYCYNCSKICSFLSGWFFLLIWLHLFLLRFNHWFDGMALMHRFHIKDGQVTYSSCFLRSDSYVQNSEKNRIVVSEFGTLATPDPCKNIFARFFSRFQIPSKHQLEVTSFRQNALTNL